MNDGSLLDLDQKSEIPPLTLQRLIRILIERRLVSAAIIAGCFLVGVIYLHFAPQTYTIEMQVVATSGEERDTQSSLGASSALLSQFSGNANGQQNIFELYQAGLQSIETARALAQNPVLMHRMFASEWSERDRIWRRPYSLLGAVVRIVKELLGIYVAPWEPPDAIRVNEFLQGNIAVSRSLTSPVVTVSMQTGDRQFGLNLMNALHSTVDDILRRRTLARVTGYIDYLNGLIVKATVVEIRAAMAETIMQQEKTRMEAASGAPYAADLFARPTPSRIPTSPKGVTVLFVSILIGIFIALAEAIMHDRLHTYQKLLAWPMRQHWWKRH